MVGIGASLGGMQALEDFVASMPADSQVAVIVLQYVSPNFDCLSEEVLQRLTPLPVQTASDRTSIKPQRIYLIPPRVVPSLEGEVLRLHPESQLSRLQLKYPINHFFESLAKEAGRRAIGVLLSGTGIDGTRGLQSIGEAGGLTFVQSPMTAEFDSMPQSAIAAGMVDRVLPPAEIARTISDLLKRSQSDATDALLSSNLFIPDLETQKVGAIIQILNECENLDFSYYKASTLNRRIYRRFSLSSYTSLDSYIDHLSTSEIERCLLRDDLMIGVTQFFRDPEAWGYLEREILTPLIDALDNSQQLRVWVTACSTGEEAYSMAMLLDEVCDRLNKRLTVKIFATDIDDAALAQAGEGIYPDSIAMDVSSERLRKYFLFRDGKFQVVRSLRESIIFAPHNLVKNAGFTQMHLISCRNVLIYMQPKLQHHVIRTLHFSLTQQGTLFLGSAETPGNLIDEFIPLSERHRLYRKKRDVRLPILTQSLEYSAPPYPKASLPPPAVPRFDPLLNMAFSLFARQRGCTCVLINENLELIHCVTDAAGILRIPEGAMTQGVTELVPTNLKLPISTALQRARHEGSPIRYDNVAFYQGDRLYTVTLDVSYSTGDRQHEPFYLLTVENEALVAPNRSSESFEQHTEAYQRILELEQELQHTRATLQATIEELETTNQEQQSTNEELLASNEELQSTNEELHSVNEELYTVNAEYQAKIKELTELTSDIDNLLRSSEIGVIFLDSNLNIRKFTPAATPAVNLRDTDIDRPIQHITHNMDCDNLIDLLRQVIKTHEFREQEVQIRGSDRHLLLRIYPYLNSLGQADGLVMTFVNIDDIKQVQLALEQQTEELEDLYATAPVGMALVDEEYRFLRINAAMAEINGLSIEEHLGKTVRQVLPSVADLVEPILQRILDTNQPVVNLEVKGTTPSKPNVMRDWIASYFPVHKFQGPRRVCAIVVEVTEMKAAQIALHQQIQQEQLLKQITELIRQSLDASEIFAATVNSVGQSFQADRCLLHTYNANEHSTVLPIVAEYVAEGVTAVGEAEVPLVNNPHLQALLCSDQAIATPDVRSDRLLAPQVHLCEQFGIKSMLAVRTSYQGKANGVISLHHCPAAAEVYRYWSVDEIYMLESVAQQVGIAIAHADLLNQAQRRQDELAQQNLALAIATEEAEAANRTKSGFLATMSHELRTPLTAVLGLSETLLEEVFGALNDQQKQAIRTVESSGEHLLNLINDILDLSKIESGNLELTLSRISPRYLCEASVLLIEQIAKQKNIDIQIHIPASMPHLWVDERRLCQVLLNLLSNAVKFTPEGGQVNLAVDMVPVGTPLKTQQSETIIAERSTVLMTVSDTGIGISAENQQKLFRPFTQIDNELNRQYEGTGLGLSLSQHIVRLHDGWIYVESEINRGSSFTLVLPYALHEDNNSLTNTPASALAQARGEPVLVPLSSISPSAIAPSSTAPQSSVAYMGQLPMMEVSADAMSLARTAQTPQGITILIAEDNKIVCDMIQTWLEKQGYSTILAATGEEAVARAQTDRPNLVLMDIQMPDMDGIEALRLIRRSRELSHIPVIALTALVMLNDRERCLQAGADAYISKPLKKQELISAIQALLHRAI